MELNERIFYLLKKNGQTAKELADYISIKSSSISAWKNCGSFPSSKYIVGISTFLGVSEEFLLTGKDNTHPILHSLSQDEAELLTTYKQLDSRGKHKLHTLMYEEVDRINSSAFLN